MDTTLSNQVISNTTSTVKSNENSKNMSSQNKASASESSQTKKYNLRERKETDEEKRKLKQDCSSDDEDYITGDSDEYDSEQEEMDLLEYRKFLANMFPSKHASETVKLQDKIKKRIKPQVVESESEEEADSDDGSDSEEDSDDYYSEEEYQQGKAMGFNILFTISDKRDVDDEDEDETDSEDEDEDVDEGDDDVEPEEEDDDEAEIVKMIKKNCKANANAKSSEKDDKNKKGTVQKKSEKSKDVSTKKQSEAYDDKTSAALKEMISVFKKKKQDAAPELFKKFEQMIDEEDKKLQQKKVKENKKLIKKNCKKFRSLMYEKSQQDEMKFFRNASMDEQKSLIEKMELINQHTKISKPYKLSLIESDIPIHYKAAAMKKINSLNYMDQGSGEYYKIKQWVDTFMKIPFGKYATLPLTMEDGIEKCDAFMQNAKDVLNEAVYGLDDAKLQILQMMAQWISNPQSVGNAIAIKGPMGTGKTTLVKEGISKILNRPFAFIALGGATDSSFLEGHSYTYEGSVWGKIVDIIIQSKCMNPIIYFDELDKVSDTPKGEEIIGILTHLTDTTQNTQFHDKYFSGIDFDLSKCLFIFSYNDEHKVNPILRDRMYRIQTQGYNGKQKKTISRDYLIPKIEENVRFNKGEITVTDKAIDYMVREYTQGEKGVRNLKRCLEIVYTKLNMYRLMKPSTKLFNDVETFEVQYPFNVDEEVVQKLIKKNESDKWYKHMYV
jgi:ATP-dependent Lon protease